MEEANAGRLYVMTAQIPESGIERFHAYETLVLPLLEQHGARLERRLRSEDRREEVHLVRFPSEEAFQAYRNDPRRTEHAHLLRESDAVTTLTRMFDCL